MNRQQSLLALTLREAQVPLSVKTFDDRLVLQKAVYLLQAANIHLGYRYRWYLRGPYSTEVASDAFFIVGQHETLNEELKRWVVDDTSRQRIEQLQPLFTPNGRRPISQRLELLASVLFLLKTNQAEASAPDNIARILKINDKPFNEQDVQEALAELRQYDLVA